MRTTLAAILLASAGSAPALASENDNWMRDLECQTKPLDAPSGYVVKAYREYASLTHAKIELYSYEVTDTDTRQTLLATYPAEKDINTGGADEIISRFVGPDILLESHLDLSTDPPSRDAERSWAEFQRDGRGVRLDLTCF